MNLWKSSIWCRAEALIPRGACGGGSTRGRKAMGPGRGLPTLTYKAHWRHWSSSRGCGPDGSLVQLQLREEAGGYPTPPVPRQPLSLSSLASPNVHLSAKAIECPPDAQLSWEGLDSTVKKRKSSGSFQMRGIRKGRKAGTMSSVERRDSLFGAFTDKHGLWGTHSELGIILSPRGALRGRKMRLVHGELILQHRGEVPVKGARRCLKTPLPEPLRRLPASVSL